MNLYDFDYGTLPAGAALSATLQTPAECIRCREWDDLLILCGKGKNLAAMSDYAYFEAVCQSCELLAGNGTARATEALLREKFGWEKTLCGNDAADAWKFLSDRLTGTKTTLADLLPEERVHWLLPTLEIPEDLPENVLPMPDANLFFGEDPCGTLDAWQERVYETVKSFAAKGAKAVRFRLPEGIAFEQPDPYHAEQTLLGRERGADVPDLLYAQAFRVLCRACRKADVALLLECDCSDSTLTGLLRYAERAVGLPNVVFAAPKPLRGAILSFLVSHPAVSARLAVRLSDTPSEGELHDSVASLAERYPTGCAAAVCGTDLRLLPAARKRIAAGFCADDSAPF